MRARLGSQVKVHAHFGHDLHWNSVQIGRLVYQPFDGFHSGLQKQRLAADQDEVLYSAISAYDGLQLHHSADMSMSGQRWV